jgi:TolB protein
VVPVADEFGGMSLELLRVDGSGAEPFDVGCCFNDIQSLTWSPDGGRIAFVGIEESDVLGTFRFPVIVDLAVPGEHELPPRCDRIDTTDVAWSPDGSNLAMAAAGHIFIFEFATGTCTQITNGPWIDDSPSWSPDGTHLAFITTRDGNAEIYVMGADGSAPTRITRSPVGKATPKWRP